ncbi:hypothetical protein [Idiomarina seosinensis]|uniref:Uncharacterized protein n=1 Tax=Idiomarina seosinensis TaxID=281739 RepID=A0A432ZIE2_9GAMM|nr:hypothetical protein [Idiomarina seosinensis]RUO77795.1 hypothetical protein CWI81_04765 [Idiomarina seosinensis]
MSQKIQTKLNDSAHICRQQGDKISPCGYHHSRVHCQFAGITEDLLETSQDSFHGFLKQGAATTELAKWFSATYLPAGSWYLVKEQRLWLKQRLIEQFRAHQSAQPLQVMIAGVAGYVHALGQLLIYLEALEQSQAEINIAITFVDRCDFPLKQIAGFLEAIKSKSFFRYKFQIGEDKYACAKGLDKAIRDKRQALARISVDYRLGDLSDPMLFAGEQFDLITEHFMTSLLYKNFDVIQPIRANYAHWLKHQGRLLSADGLRADSDAYQTFVELNRDAGLVVNQQARLPVWDPYGLQQEVFQNILEGNTQRRVAVELDNTLSEFIKQ